MTEKQKKTLGVIAILVFLLFCGIVGYFIGKPMLRFVGEPESFRSWVDSHGVWSRVVFVLMVILQVVIAFIPGEPLEIGAGYAFGAWEGTFLCLLGMVIGSVLVFEFVRHFGVKVVEIFFSKEKIQSLHFLQSSGKLNVLTFIVLAIPGTPKDLLSYFIGLTEMPLSTWVFISAIARIPSVVTSTVGGNALGTENYLSALIVFAVTILISVIGIFIYRSLSKLHQKRKKKREENKTDLPELSETDETIEKTIKN